MKNKISTLEELKAEKRLLRLEIEATEKLIVQSLHISKDHLLEGAADAMFSLIRREPIESDDFAHLFSSQFEGKDKNWWQQLTPFVPLVLKMIGFFYEKKRAKKKLRKGEIVLHKAAS